MKQDESKIRLRRKSVANRNFVSVAQQNVRSARDGKESQIKIINQP